MMASGIYEILNTETGKRYVGSAVDLKKRERDHFARLRRGDHENAHLQHEFDKYGEDAFEFRAVLECRPADLTAREQERIDLYDFGELYNASPTAGSCRGMKHSDEARRNMSAAQMGNQNALGHEVSDEVRARISAATKGNQRALGNQSYLGRVHSAETKAKMSAAALGNQNAKGHVHSEATQTKISAAATTWWAKQKAKGAE